MKAYKRPEVDLILFDADVITTSIPLDDDELPVVHSVSDGRFE